MGVVSHGKALFKIAKNLIGSSLNSERIWEDYLGRIPDRVKQDRFIRINPELSGEVPALDEVPKMKTLQGTVRSKLAGNPIIEQVANRLIASSFCFDVIGPLSEKGNGCIVAQGESG